MLVCKTLHRTHKQFEILKVTSGNNGFDKDDLVFRDPEEFSSPGSFGCLGSILRSEERPSSGASVQPGRCKIFSTENQYLKR